MALRWSIYVLTAALFLLGLVALGSIVHYACYSAEYRFGSEVAGWRYNSASHFVGLAFAELLVAIGAVFLGSRLSSKTARAVVQGAALAALALTWWAAAGR